jgi:hypothetical protein
VILSVAASVIPKVKDADELAGIKTSYKIALDAAAAAPAILAKTLVVAADAVVLAMLRVEIIWLLAAPTVIRSALDVLAGADCPSIL